VRRLSFLITGLALTAGLLGCPSAKPTYVPRDRTLSTLPLYFYPARGDSAKAVLIFFGNDIGFWESHEQLAKQLSGHSYDVIGFDIKKYIETLPTDPTARAQAFATSVDQIIARSVAELNAQALPLVVGGHSYGADLAFWLAVHAPPPHLTGVLALGPTARSHFFVTVEDLMNVKDPTEPGSFSIADLIRSMSPPLRVALVRGAHDPRRPLDSSFVTAGGSRLRYTVVPLAGHSLHSMTIAGPMTRHALDWIVAGQ
jgi:pimeloyl-ACP methyl ester carboxylesterase